MANYYIPIPVDTVIEEDEKPSYTYKLDLDKGRIVGMINGIEAVKQAIRKAIITPRFKCLIYDNQYGSEIEDAIMSDNATNEYIRAATEGFVKDALSQDTRILNISGFEFEFKDDGAYISFDVSTIFGEISVEEVM